MAAIINADDGVISGASGLKLSSDTSGALNIQTNGVTAIAISASQAVSFPATTSLNFTSANITTLTSSSATITNLIATTASISDLSATVTRSASGTITNLLATTATISASTYLATASGSVGIGTTSPGAKLEIKGSNNEKLIINADLDSANYQNQLSFKNNGTQYAALTSGKDSGNNSVGLVFYTGTSERMRLDASGNLGLGIVPSAWASNRSVLQLKGGTSSGGCYLVSGAATQAFLGTNAYSDGTNFIYLTSAQATLYAQSVGEHAWYTAPSGTAGNTITLTQAMTLDASGNLILGPQTGGVGVATPTYLQLGSQFASTAGDAAKTKVRVFQDTSNNIYGFGVSANLFENHVPASAGFAWYVNNGEKARITSGGVFCVGTTSTDPRVDNVAGVAIGVATGIGIFSRTSGPAIDVNRKTDDGTLVNFAQDGTIEGTISVSGNTVSYNAFAGSHWSQLQDGSKLDILRGTVMESINELCVWPDEQNERLPKAKISDTAGSKKVYGVFMAWDNDWTETNDMYVTAVGAFICRVNGSVTVQEGDLLESNGDGTARVQADDIIRSSTIGKVTSTVKTHEYDDGSYCVPTVLYCG